MKNLFCIFIGGGVGSVLRYLISAFTNKLWIFNLFPIGTLLVNVMGCFLIGILLSVSFKDDSAIKPMLVAGFCGGFTTFSAFSAESVNLFQNGHYILLGIYMLLSIVLGFGAVLLGLFLMRT